MTVNICGIPHKVTEHKDRFDTDIHFGMIDHTKNEILINSDLAESAKKETICHEMVHGMLFHLGYHDLHNDETFVQALGNAINQGFEIKEAGE